ncbi:hypothetical protein F4818DRAFT_253231 [Hypoxylon cercidicola]|nr:hypothetical protein F4818DRAFT_253231 [Hypoxylon cercidicola]
MSRRMEVDAQYAECRVKLEQVAHDGFYLRYGDYYAMTLQQLRTEAIKVDKEAKKIAKKSRNKRSQPSEASETGVEESSLESKTMRFFMTQTWAAIDERLDEEEKPRDEDSSFQNPQDSARSSRSCYDSQPPSY